MPRHTLGGETTGGSVFASCEACGLAEASTNRAKQKKGDFGDLAFCDLCKAWGANRGVGGLW